MLINGWNSWKIKAPVYALTNEIMVYLRMITKNLLPILFCLIQQKQPKHKFNCA